MEMMHDLGEERVSPEVDSPKAERGKTYPSVTLNESTCPFLAGMQIGDTVTVTFEAKIKSVREAEQWDESKGNHYNLELKKASYDHGKEAKA